MSALNPFSEDLIPAGFIGRQAELAQVHRMLTEADRSVLVTGPRGCGKTAFVRAYAHDHRDAWSRTAFVSTGSMAGPSAFHHVLAHQLSLDTAAHDSVQAALRAERALVIVDDLTELPLISSDAIFREIREAIDARARARFLITGSEYHTPRLMQDGSGLLGRLALFSLAGLTPSDFQRAFTSRGIDAPPEVVEGIHARTNGHPLALQLLLASLEGGAHTASDVLLRLENAYFKEWGSVLTNVIVMPTTDGLRAFPVSRDDASGILTPNAQLFVGAPYVHVRSHSVFWRQKLDKFDELLNDSAATEHHFQEFFERNPQFLLGLDYDRAIPHPVLYRDADGPLIPDFFLQPLDRKLCDILDLKLPNEKLVVGSKNRFRLSSSIYEVVAQLREYSDYFDDPKLRADVQAKYGITAFKPALSVVIGRTPRHVSDQKYRQILEGTSGVKILTYDDLRRQMQRLVDRMSF